MRVEAGRDDHEVGPEALAAAAGSRFRIASRNWSPPSPGRSGALTMVLCSPRSVQRAGAGIERHLVRRAVHHGRVGPENLLAAVAVMHVEIDDRDALGAVLLLRVARRDRRIVEQAEAHRPSRSRRDGRAGASRRRRCGPCRHHLVDRLHRAAGRAQRRLEAAGRHRGVGIDPHHALPCGDASRTCVDVVHRVAERDRLERRPSAPRSRASGWNVSCCQRALDRAQPVRPLGMARRA